MSILCGRRPLKLSPEGPLDRTLHVSSTKIPIHVFMLMKRIKPKKKQETEENGHSKKAPSKRMHQPVQELVCLGL